MTKYFLVQIVWVCCGLLSPLTQAQNTTPGDSIVKDDHSFADPTRATTKHLDLTLSVDFDKKQLTGKAAWIIDSKGQEIIFDTQGLTIQKVTLGEPERPATYFLDAPLPLLGSALHIAILPTTQRVTIYYATTPTATALQWLSPQQTTDKKKPYLFTQSYSIWARSWLPCQDMPGVRFTYSARVRVPQGLLAAMSAQGPRRREASGIYQFAQSHPIPAYLMALAVGDMAFKAIDDRTGVYAEPSLLEKAAWEFAHMGKMVTAAESLYGPYRWGRFDVLVTPPSFTASGMENPNLVFLNPALLAGDRSLTYVVAHELAHSWSGNLVTNATWNDFWLNEGVTTYFTLRIGEVLYGKAEAAMQTVISRTRLGNQVAAFGASSPDTHLKLDLRGRNPDDALTDIPYQKGCAFLQTIEQAVSRPRFDAFLRRYFTRHAFQAHTTEEFLSTLNQELFQGDSSLINRIREHEWVYSGGIPANIAPAFAPKFKAVDSLLAHLRDTDGLSELGKKIRSYNEKYYFLQQLPTDLTTQEMAQLDQAFNFTYTNNRFLQRSWLVLCVEHHYRPADAQLESFMRTYGTYSIVLYKALRQTPAGKTRARTIFEQARLAYHPLTSLVIEKLLRD